MSAEIERWDKRFAAGCYNRAWELLEKRPRSADEDADLLATAFAQRFHWFRVGEAHEKAIAEWQVSRAAAALRHGRLAVEYAERARTIADGCNGPDFLMASIYEGLARAYAAAGDVVTRDRWLAEARTSLAGITEEDDREVIEQQIADVPGA